MAAKTRRKCPKGDIRSRLNTLMQTRPLPPTDREAIREIFLRRRSEYTPQQAASLLRLNLTEGLALIDQRPAMKRKRRHRTLVTWNELASAAMLRWNVMQIHDALGDDADRVMPRLLRPVEVKSLRLPEYQVRLLETLAQNDGVSVEEYLYTALLDLEVASDPEEVERLVPGFREAMRFPDV